MAKKSIEQSIVSEVQGIQKPMRRSERSGRGTAVSIRQRKLLDYDPSGTVSRNLLESFQNILLLTNRSNLASRTF